MKGIFWNSRGLSDLALLETGKKDYSKAILNKICASQNYFWHWTTPHGRSGGMLLGINLDTYDIGGVDEGDFYIKFHLRNIKVDFRWILVAVYGAAQPEFKEAFLYELVQTCAKENLPLLVGGDYNIVRNPQEKNNDRYDDRWPFLFNAIIDSLNLHELRLSNRKYTWANSRETPTYETLDRILVSTDWETKFPLSTVQALTREISDHTPLFLNTGTKCNAKKQPIFRFELGWLLRDDFDELVKEVCSNKKEKAKIIAKVDGLDKKAES
jgi:hypothetical protein